MATIIEAPALDLTEMGKTARDASRVLATLTTEEKNAALLAIADELEARAGDVMAQNAARHRRRSRQWHERCAAGPAAALLKNALPSLAADARSVATLADPVGSDIDGRVLPNGLRLSRRRIPIGVLGVIYEARPNVTIDIATLALKTGNAVILRGGKETLRSNMALVDVIHMRWQR